MQYMGYAILFLIVLGFIKKWLDKEPTTEKSEDPAQFKGMYKSKYILSLNEKDQYLKIKTVTDKLGLYLFAKVRLADILEPVSGQKNWKALWYKIQAKHVDFFICKPNMANLCVIEIDDSSHSQTKRKQRDAFVDFILADVKIPTIRKYEIRPVELEAELRKIM